MNEEQVKNTLLEILPSIDEEISNYFTSIIIDQGVEDTQLFYETFIPFIESYSLVLDHSNAEETASLLRSKLLGLGLKTKEIFHDNLQLLNKSTNFNDLSKNFISESEQASIDTMWGFDKIRSKRNDVIELNEAGSAKYERKALKEQKKWLEQLECKFIGDEEENAQISIMTLPDLTGNNREKDIHVKNFNITFGGSLLLESADLRIVYGRRFGLVGRNGMSIHKTYIYLCMK